MNMNTPQASRTQQPGDAVAPRLTPVPQEPTAKNAQNAIVPTRPLAKQQQPDVALGAERAATPQALQPTASPPATVARSPWTLRVEPKPTTGEPVSALRRGSSASSVRRLLLCGFSSRVLDQVGQRRHATKTRVWPAAIPRRPGDHSARPPTRTILRTGEQPPSCPAPPTGRGSSEYTTGHSEAARMPNAITRRRVPARTIQVQQEEREEESVGGAPGVGVGERRHRPRLLEPEDRLDVGDLRVDDVADEGVRRQPAAAAPSPPGR